MDLSRGFSSARRSLKRRLRAGGPDLRLRTVVVRLIRFSLLFSFPISLLPCFVVGLV